MSNSTHQNKVILDALKKASPFPSGGVLRHPFGSLRSFGAVGVKRLRRREADA